MFPDRLRAVRIFRNLSQEQIAKGLNMSLRAYTNYEEGKRSPGLDRLVELADFLDVSVDYLLGRDKWLSSHELSVENIPDAPPRRLNPFQRPSKTSENPSTPANS